MTALTATAETIERTAADMGLTMRAKFVPWSQSRHAGEKSPSLNWKVTIRKDGRDILTTDYMAGSAHCPSYEQGNSNANRAAAIKAECEKGFKHNIDGFNPRPALGRKPILPDLADVLASLCMDAAAIDCATFEEWARESGYDTDSRKAEAIYRACLEIGLKLRNRLGEAGLTKLWQACRDY